ncbi:MAG: hypothetical protein N3G20_08860, partial [Verrucomicrobiae bacterium]|nr:hypothetical protein [Verrucomicrobiae bacterium]
MPPNEPILPGNPPRRILVIRGGAIGDFVLTLPVFAALRANFPGADIEVLGYPHIAMLAVLGKLADAVHPIESPAMTPMFVKHTHHASRLAEFFGRFDLIISYLYDPDAVFEQNVRKLCSATYLRAPHRPNEDLEQHATETFLQPIRSLGIQHPDPIPRLKLPIHPQSWPRTGPT